MKTLKEEFNRIQPTNSRKITESHKKSEIDEVYHLVGDAIDALANFTPDDQAVKEYKTAKSLSDKLFKAIIKLSEKTK